MLASVKAKFKARNIARKILGPLGLWLSLMLFLGAPIASEAGRVWPWWTVWLALFSGPSTIWAVLVPKACPTKNCSGDLHPSGAKSEWSGAEIKKCSKVGKKNTQVWESGEQRILTIIRLSCSHLWHRGTKIFATPTTIRLYLLVLQQPPQP
jgi:hypothetical protein